ncbi:hypothetical protein [Actinophytocola sp.]|uniref:hypothetical protein n=1 Tax=Actinophytocola sp. TaxID=1872138 RepID=UPI002D7F7DB6|nr:hypothetical protein [Actinophytocola sp.]HET9142591.1 hypothetical protein [Actinophytocola sp.]HEU5110402.1 hypothetical protein [Micromonosporaceae bacterium]
MNAKPDEPDDEPVMPTADEAAAARQPLDRRPTPVRYAMIVWITAGACGVLNAIILMANKQDLINTWIRTKEPDVTNEQIIRGANTLLWTFMVAALVFAVLFALFAYKAQDGIRRARLLLTMLGLVTVLFYFLILPTQFGLMTALLAATATVLMYLPSSNVFFRPTELPT